MVVAHSLPLSAAESSFRELDDAFLQTQTRIWLGELLQTRLSENLDISDLLADGELLFNVSRVVWKMLLTTCMELRNIKIYKYEPFAYQKSSRRYMPYSNVDTFLKICKILGLTGIDLFSPSDVVEKKNTRKVCMCIRLLSKKARSKRLSVPDFDVVTYTVAMPTEMVGCIRRSLEQPQHIFLSTASQNSLTVNCRKRNSIAGSSGNSGLCSDEFDDSECNFIIQSDGSSTNCPYDASSPMNFYSVDSPRVSAVIGNFTPEKQFSPFEVENQEQNGYQHKIESICLNELEGSCFSLLGDNDYQLEGLSSSIDSSIHLGSRISHIENESSHGYENGTPDVSYCDLAVQNGAGEDSTGDGALEKNNFITIVISNRVYHERGIGDSIQFDGDDSTFKEYTSPSSHGSNSTPRTIENGFRSKLAHVNDAEVFSTPHIISLPDIVKKLDFDDKLDAGDDFKTVWLPELQNHNANNETQNIVNYQKLMHCSTPNTEKPHIDIELIDNGFNTKLFRRCSDTQSCIANCYHGIVYDNRICMSLDSSVENNKQNWLQLDSNCLKNVHCEQCLEFLAHFHFDFHLSDQKGKFAIATISDENDGDKGNESSSHFISQEGLYWEIAYHRPDKARGDALVHKDIKSGVKNDEEVTFSAMAESDQPNNLLHTPFSSIVLDTKYKDIKNSIKLKSIKDGCSFQHQGIMIADNSGQSKHMLGKASMDDPSVHHNFVGLPSSIEQISDKHSCATSKCIENVGCTFHKTDSSCAENGDKVRGQDHKQHEKAEVIENSDRTDDGGVKVARHRSHRRLLLRSVVRGTAVLGVLFLLLQLRKSGREKAGESNMQPDKVWKENGMKVSSQKEQKEGRVNGIYPANNLGLGI